VSCDDEPHALGISACDGHGSGVRGVTVPGDAPTKTDQHLLTDIVLMALEPVGKWGRNQTLPKWSQLIVSKDFCASLSQD
jgi:hypothetical protein